MSGRLGRNSLKDWNSLLAASSIADRVLFVGFIVSMLLGRLFHLALFLIITIIFIGKMSRFKCNSLKNCRNGGDFQPFVFNKTFSAAK